MTIDTPPRPRIVDRDVYIRVLTYDLLNKDDEPSQERTINYSDKSDREWLAKHTFWCFCNHHSVETYNLADEALASGVAA